LTFSPTELDRHILALCRRRSLAYRPRSARAIAGSRARNVSTLPVSQSSSRGVSRSHR
jgi:hypothetical protein